MDISTEHVEKMVDGMTPFQIILLILLGGIIFIGFLNVVKWMIDIKLGTIPEDIKNLNNAISADLKRLEKAIIEIQAKLWTKEDIATEIKNAINQHILDCPIRNKDKKS